MYFSDNLDYELDHQLDQMRWEYERAIYEKAHIENKESNKKQPKIAKGEQFNKKRGANEFICF